MKNLFFIFLVALLSTATLSASSKYMVDEAAIEQVIENSTEVSDVTVFEAENTLKIDQTTTSATHQLRAGNDNAIAAFLLCWFVGYLGIHRFYMGTETLTGVAYILTGGGCGIVVTIDWIMLLIGLIEDDISSYVDNPKFFMWAK